LHRGWDAADLEELMRKGVVVSSVRMGGVWWYKVEGRSVERKRMACRVEFCGREIVVQAIA
jgi:hypothetical protein